MGRNLPSVADELLIHINGAKSCSIDASTDQKLTIQRISDIDRESPSDPRWRGIERDSRIVAVVQPVRQTMSKTRGSK